MLLTGCFYRPAVQERSSANFRYGHAVRGQARKRDGRAHLASKYFVTLAVHLEVVRTVDRAAKSDGLAAGTDGRHVRNENYSVVISLGPAGDNVSAQISFTLAVRRQAGE